MDLQRFAAKSSSSTSAPFSLISCQVDTKEKLNYKWLQNKREMVGTKNSQLKM